MFSVGGLGAGAAGSVDAAVSLALWLHPVHHGRPSTPTPNPGSVRADRARHQTPSAHAAWLSSLADETPEGRSIVVLAKNKYSLRGREVSEHEAEFVPFTAQTRMSGVNIDGRQIRKGATESIAKFVQESGGSFPANVTD